MHKRYPQGFRQPSAFDVEGQDLRAEGSVFAGISFYSADARFIGNPINFAVFDGYTIAKDDKGDTISVVLVEVKKGKGKLKREEMLIKKEVEEGQVSWRTIF